MINLLLAIFVSASTVVPMTPESTDTAFVQCNAVDTLVLQAQETYCSSFTGWDLNGDGQVDVPAQQCKIMVVNGLPTYTYEKVVSNVGQDEHYVAIFTTKMFQMTINTDGDGDVTISTK